MKESGGGWVTVKSKRRSWEKATVEERRKVQTGRFQILYRILSEGISVDMIEWYKAEKGVEWLREQEQKAREKEKNAARRR